MAFMSNIHTCPLIPETALASNLLKHLQMASMSSHGTCQLIPETAMVSCPLQDLQMASMSSHDTCLFILETVLTLCSLMHLQMAPFRSIHICSLIPGTVLTLCPLKHLQMASMSKKGSMANWSRSRSWTSDWQEQVSLLADMFANELLHGLQVVHKYLQQQFIGKHSKDILLLLSFAFLWFC